MLSATQSQRIERYLGELEAALASLAVAERQEAVSGVREHIEAALADLDDVSDDDVDRVLRSLGDPLAIAAESGSSAEGLPRSGSSGAPGPEAGRSGPVLRRPWVPGFVVATLFLSPFLFLLVSFGGILLLPFALLTGWVMLWLSPLWSGWEKLAGTFLIPASGVATMLSLTLTGGTSVCEGSGTVTPDGVVVESQTCVGDGGSTSIPIVVLLVVLAAASVVTAVIVYLRGRRRVDGTTQSRPTDHPRLRSEQL